MRLQSRIIFSVLLICTEQFSVRAIVDNCANCFPLTLAPTICTIPICSGSPTLPTSVDSNGLAAGMAVRGPVPRGSCFPPWINIAKFNQGQNFLAQHYGAIGLAEYFTLGGLLAFDQMSDVLLFTATNDCPVAASRRYSSTAENIILWGLADISLMENPYVVIRSIDKVRNTHQVAANRVRRVGNLGNADRFKNEPVNDVVWNAFHEDIAAAYPEKLEFSSYYQSALGSYVHFNHFQYAMTQWSFSSMITLARDRTLIPGATDAEIEAFNHMWAVVGYMKGIDDSYNIPLHATTVEALRQHYDDILVQYVIPALYNIGHDAKYFYELSNDRTQALPFTLNDVTITPPIEMDAFLLGTLRVVLNITNIQNTKLYAVASPSGKLLIDTVDAIISYQNDITQIANDAALNTASQAQLAYWAARDYGSCYADMVTYCQKANNLHYTYTGPDVNPNGEQTDCSAYSSLICQT